MTLIISKDRATDPTVCIVSCELDGAKLNENYFYDPQAEDATIDANVTTDLQAKGYTLS